MNGRQSRNVVPGEHRDVIPGDVVNRDRLGREPLPAERVVLTPLPGSPQRGDAAGIGAALVGRRRAAVGLVGPQQTPDLVLARSRRPLDGVGSGYGDEQPSDFVTSRDPAYVSTPRDPSAVPRDGGLFSTKENSMLFLIHCTIHEQKKHLREGLVEKHLANVAANKSSIVFGGVVGTEEEPFQQIIYFFTADSKSRAHAFIENDAYTALYRSVEIEEFQRMI